MLRLDPWACILGAVLLLTLPLRWLLAAVLAAAVHEGCHVGMGYLVGGRVHGFRLGPRGAVLDMAFPSRAGELLCALAGPVGSLLLVTLCHRFPRLALCGLVQGVFNLLPIFPLDGGRIGRCMVEMVRIKACKACGECVTPPGDE